MFKRLSFLILFTVFFGQSILFAEVVVPKAVILGLIIDKETKHPLQFATVALFNVKDSSAVDGMITDETGAYQFKNVANGTYLLTFSFIGYANQSSKPFEVTKMISNLSLNLYYNQFDGSNIRLSSKQSNVVWQAKLNTTATITPTTLFQVNASYMAPRLTAQGKMLERYMVNFGLRQDIFSKKTSVIFTIYDLLTA